MIHRLGCGRVRHLQTRYLWHQQALREGQFNVVRCGTKENPSDLGTKVPARDAMASCMSKLAVVPATTLRGAVVAALARVTTASDEVIVDGCCSERVGNTTTEKQIQKVKKVRIVTTVEQLFSLCALSQFFILPISFFFSFPLFIFHVFHLSH